MSEDRYTFEEKIGRGGIGAVYRAYDNQLGRQVAVKRMLPPEESDLVNAEDASSSLLKEAKVLSTLNHPNIVTVFDVGADSKGVFVVMELLDGETLDETISRGVLAEEDFSEVVVQSLEALIAAQDIDLVHRDIKPGNVMVVWLPSGKFQLKILDFGLAKFSERPSVQTSDQGDAILGSIFFMAPEQFERGELDGRTDLYSLGCIYYHCLTGKYPFQGDTAAQVMASHLQNSMVPIDKYRPDLPLWLCSWVKWLLQREAANRPENAKMALEHFMDKTVGLPALQLEIEIAESAGVTLVGGGSPAVGTAFVVAARPAAPPTLVVAGGGVTGVRHQPMVRSKAASGAAKWIAIGASALIILGVGCYALFNRMAASKQENDFLAIVEEDVPFGDAQTVQAVVRYMGPGNAQSRKEAAAGVLSRMEGDGVDEEILRQLDNFRGAEAAALVTALTVRNYAPALEKISEIAASSSNADLQQAAVNAIMLMGKSEQIGVLIGVLKNVEDQKVRDSAVKAILTLARSVEDARGRTGALLGELEKADGPFRKSLAAILGALGGDGVLKKFRSVLATGKPEFQYDVLAALIKWPDDSAADLLQKLALETEDPAVRKVAARAYIRLIGMPAPRAPGRQQEMMDIAMSLADDPREKARLLPILSEIPQDWASEYAGKLEEFPVLKDVAEKTKIYIRQDVGDVQPLESGVPLKAASATIGGSHEASYNKEIDCIEQWESPETWISWNFIVDDPGTYTVELAQANDDVPKSGYEVIIGENALYGTVENTRSWSRFTNVKLGEVELPEEGVHTLSVKPRGAAKEFIMNLKSVTLTKK